MPPISEENHLEAWLRYEQQFEQNGYNGHPNGAGVVHLPGNRDLLATAPHATNQTRHGLLKLADRRTGGLAILLAETFGASALAVSAKPPEQDPWGVRNDAFASILRNVRPTTPIIDLHGMGDTHGMEVCVGLGPLPNHRIRRLADLVTTTFEDMGASVSIDSPFSGRSDHTVTAFAQRRGGTAVQIEFAASLRDPDGMPERANITVLGLASIVHNAAGLN